MALSCDIYKQESPAVADNMRDARTSVPRFLYEQQCDMGSMQ